MTNEKLEQKIDDNLTNTEYRLIKNKTHIAEYYLQFKSIKKETNFPDIWNNHDVECWRYVPKIKYNIFDYLDESKCPIKIFDGQEIQLMSCFYNQEKYELIPFTKKYPTIRKYFQEFNTQRDNYLKSNNEKNIAPDIITISRE